jgi:ribosomal protein S18 acetylase RimI-like enzyme
MLLNTDIESQQAIQFYHRFGFKDIPRYTDEGGEIAMRLEL